jgi:exosortase A
MQAAQFQSTVTTRTDEVWFAALVGFAFLLLGFFLLFFDAASSMASIWINSSNYHHGLFAAPIALWMIAGRGAWRGARPGADWRGLWIIAGAAFLWLFSRAAAVELFGHAAVVLAIIGAVVATFGGAIALRWAMPLGFLFFMVPVGAEALPLLQRWTAVAAGFLLNASGVATARDGFILSTSAGRFEVAQSCAGLRFLIASAMIAMAASALAFCDWRKRILFSAAAIGAALVANWLRVYLLVLVATLTDCAVGLGAEHVAVGWAIYALLALALVATARRFADQAGDQARRSDCPPLSGSAPAHLVLPAALAVAAAAVVYDRMVISAAPAAELPLAEPGDGSLAAFGWTPVADGASARSDLVFESASGPVHAVRVQFGSERQGAEMVGANVRAADGLAWRRIAVAKQAFLARGRAHSLVVETIVNDRNERLSVATLYELDGRLYADPVALKFAIALQRLRGRSPSGSVVFAATGAAAAPASALQEFFSSAYDAKSVGPLG